MDFDGDGRNDVLSGSWPGELFLFRRQSDGTFAKRVDLKDKTGESINVGSASHLFATDWDSDHDLDLLVGNISGEVYFIRNEGTKENGVFDQPVRIHVNGKPIETQGGDAAPTAADWDGDGMVDLLLGSASGAVHWYRNTGTTIKPVLAAAKVLIPAIEDEDDAKEENDSKEKSPRCGGTSKVCVVDWNGDGKLDLLVGDDSIEVRTITLSKKQESEKQKLERRIGELDKRYERIENQLENKETSSEKRKKLEKEQEDILTEHSEVGEALGEYETTQYVYHGHVWLFLNANSTGIATTAKK